MRGYRELSLNDSGAPTYIKEASVNALKKVDAIVFDCDGVLLDTRESYDVSVQKTTELLLKALTGEKIVVDKSYLFRLRDTGGFNNDWNLTYALIQYTLSDLTERQRRVLGEIYEASLGKPLLDRYNYLISKTDKKEIGTIKIPCFDSFVKFLDSTGLESLESKLSETNPRFSTLIRQVLSYPGDTSESILTRLFEELFCGSELFKEIYGLTPLFPENSGLILSEKVVVSSKTLETLSGMCNGRMGIASGSGRAQAVTILGGLIGYFKPDAMVWMNDVDEEIFRSGRRGLHKPNPYSLNRAAKALEPYDRLLYLGDTQADLSMFMQSDREDIQFAGVYANTGQGENVLMEFTVRGADIVTPSVNEIPQILEMLRGNL